MSSVSKNLKEHWTGVSFTGSEYLRIGFCVVSTITSPNPTKVFAIPMYWSVQHSEICGNQPCTNVNDSIVGVKAGPHLAEVRKRCHAEIALPVVEYRTVRGTPI